MKNIGLPRNVAYACLAETIVLALDGRFENFTVGRSIEWEKVRDIYKMGLRHGMKLAAISGVNGPFSDADIRRVRKLALAARTKAAGQLAAAGAKSGVRTPARPKRGGSAMPAAAAGGKAEASGRRRPAAGKRGGAAAAPRTETSQAK
jgi:hypothetical protein